MILYYLNICDEELSYENHEVLFAIGLFSSETKAKETAEYYLSGVSGFKDYKCHYNIVEKNVIGDPSATKFYMVCGWDENENYDAVNVIESEIYSDEEAATGKLSEMKKQHKRTEWTVDFYIVDECLWKEGFVRA